MKKSVIALVICFALLLSACGSTTPTTSGSDDNKQSRVVFYFDTVITVTAYTKDKNLLDDLDKECQRFEKLLSKTVEGSDVWRINHAQGKRVPIHQETRDLLEKALEYSRISDGRFDVTVEPCVALWDFTGEGIGTLPDADELAAAAEKVDWTKIDINEDGVLLPDGMSIDLGAIAKGYISDRMAAFISERGVESAIINLGGNVRTVGLKPDGSKWRIGIQDPEGVRDQTIVGVVSLENSSVVTSGIYERGFTLDGVVYHHILDPDTGWSVQNELSGISIVTEEACTADALSTTVFTMGLEEGSKFIESLEGVDAIFITRDGKVSWTSGLDGVFSPV
ncbi:MAG: FAD:protein FMN transferase [Oscillospiraceae bacterium]|nr:FAD:protein FMN transferase [Oscillospiraceae bacterium]